MRRFAPVRALIVFVTLCAPAAGAVAPGTVPVMTPAAESVSTTHHSLAEARSYIVGRWTSGPNSYTRWQRIQITGSHKDLCFNFYDIDDVMHQYVDPTKAQPATALRVLVGCPQSAGAAAVPSITPRSWYNPFSWDWGHIMSSTWNAIWDNCLKGATEGVVGTASGTTIVNLLARGGKVFVGPYGYAAIAIGGCVVNLAW